MCFSPSSVFPLVCCFFFAATLTHKAGPDRRRTPAGCSRPPLAPVARGNPFGQAGTATGHVKLGLTDSSAGHMSQRHLMCIFAHQTRVRFSWRRARCDRKLQRFAIAIFVALRLGLRQWKKKLGRNVVLKILTPSISGPPRSVLLEVTSRELVPEHSDPNRRDFEITNRLRLQSQLQKSLRLRKHPLKPILGTRDPPVLPGFRSVSEASHRSGNPPEIVATTKVCSESQRFFWHNAFL